MASELKNSEIDPSLIVSLEEFGSSTQVWMILWWMGSVQARFVNPTFSLSPVRMVMNNWPGKVYFMLHR